MGIRPNVLSPRCPAQRRVRTLNFVFEYLENIDIKGKILNIVAPWKNIIVKFLVRHSLLLIIFKYISSPGFFTHHSSIYVALPFSPLNYFSLFIPFNVDDNELIIPVNKVN